MAQTPRAPGSALRTVLLDVDGTLSLGHELLPFFDKSGCQEEKGYATG